MSTAITQSKTKAMNCLRLLFLFLFCEWLTADDALHCDSLEELRHGKLVAFDERAQVGQIVVLLFSNRDLPCLILFFCLCVVVFVFVFFCGSCLFWSVTALIFNLAACNAFLAIDSRGLVAWSTVAVAYAIQQFVFSQKRCERSGGVHCALHANAQRFASAPIAGKLHQSSVRAPKDSYATYIFVKRRK